jgi:hypothetical protein
MVKVQKFSNKILQRKNLGYLSYSRGSIKFILKVGVEESIVNAPRTTESRNNCLNLTSLSALFVFLLCRLTRGVFTIDSSTPTLENKFK